MDSKTTIEDLKKAFNDFCDEREWEKYHDAKEMAIDINIESSEILEHFRYLSREEVNAFMTDPEKKKLVGHEMADVFSGILRICKLYDIDFSEAFLEKMEENKRKYPVEKAKGSNKKYTEYEV